MWSIKRVRRELRRRRESKAAEGVDQAEVQVRARMDRIIWSAPDGNSRDDPTLATRLEKPIFMVGVPHSGTSVLASTLKTEHEIAMWTEAPEVWEPWWGEGGSGDYEEMVPRYASDVAEMDAWRIRYAFGRFVASQQGHRLLNKNPRNTVMISYMREIFPDAKIIHIYRDPRDVVNSIIRSADRDRAMDGVCQKLIRSIEYVDSEKKNLPAGDFYELSYEDFCERPYEIMVEIFNACELDYTDADLGRLPRSLTNFNGGWKKELDGRQQARLQENLARVVQRYGY